MASPPVPTTPSTFSGVEPDRPQRTLRRSVTPACQNQQLNAGNDAERPRSPARRNIEANPVSPGHSLVIPVREITTWFDATLEEWESALRIVAAVKEQLDEALAPDGYNVGFNAGQAAGQTVFHAHIHVIPRFAGDVENPVGGVRHAVVGRGHYDAG
ncbi:hypothetical protein BCONGLO52_26600 [Brachybacterium conglomeratum]|uniref:HIT domain-containing protein n=2 Tax=Brachybacterium TaxID=43668 RepID=A0ABQ5RIW4_9MICO|nr:hypothetical protein BCONGLO52_26600 [Brachybacterium conglomeratum]GLK03352.1 hypothetical protein GCM10017597_01510 [Brachybacterium conglomeratum]